jgi:hypothetical protein
LLNFLNAQRLDLMERFAALYTRRVTQRQKGFMDGFVELTPSPDSQQTKVLLTDESGKLIEAATLPDRPPTDGTDFRVGGCLVQIVEPADAAADPRPAPAATFRRPTAIPRPAPPSPAAAEPAAAALRGRVRTVDEILAFYGDDDGPARQGPSRIESNLQGLDS